MLIIVDSSNGIKMEEAVAKNEAGQVQVNPHLPPQAKAAAKTMTFTTAMVQARFFLWM